MHKSEDSKADLKPRCLSLDLEVGVKDSRIHQLAAVRGDNGKSFVQGQQKLEKALAGLDLFAENVSFLLGHNIINFDLPHLQAVKPDLAILKLPAIDTLRLNPLAFPRNPYHRLVKHYQDGQLHRGRLNDPELNARLTLDVFHEQRIAFLDLVQQEPDLLFAWHWLTTIDDTLSGLNSFFSSLRRGSRPTDVAGIEAIEKYLLSRCCITATRDTIENIKSNAWPMAYVLAWLSVAGGNSVMPPWVRYQFPKAGTLVRKLRDIPCTDKTCQWCRERHDPKKELKRWFGFNDFRTDPADEQGRSLQGIIVEAAMRGEHVLGVLPTGTGKSLCYQIPALSRFEKTGALTLVISPLVALMADQVTGLEARGITACAALNGLLSLPERTDVLDRVRLGDIGILIVSPEQLRSSAFRKVLAQRDIGAWVIDEAHCISKWGHDFRPDYRYVGRFIREKSGEGEVAPVLCLTATAKPDVIEDICDHFKDRVGIELMSFDGGTKRDNLVFDVVTTSNAEKFNHIFQLIDSYLPKGQPGGAIVYCATRRQTEEISQFLKAKELAAERFHAKLPPESKKSIQEDFITGKLQVIAATNAFGMGIDKPDVRLVVHADIPGSLENYIQEAGRAGRDRKMARCVLLYTAEDTERQFSMSAYSRLSHKDIMAILKSLRRLGSKKQQEHELIATAGEILAEEDEGVFERDSATDDTRVRTALLWLEESCILKREENRVQVFPSSLRVSTAEEAQARLAQADISIQYKQQLVGIVRCLIDANADEGLSTDRLMGETGLNSEGLRHALYDLEHLGIASNDTALTAFVHHGVTRSSKSRFLGADALESGLISLMREIAPDLEKGQTSIFHLRQGTQHLKDAGHPEAMPEKIWRILRSLSMDGRSEEGGIGSLDLKKLDSESVQVTLQREWRDLEQTSKLRRGGAAALLEHLLSSLQEGARGNDLLAETTLGKLRQAIDRDLALQSANIRDPVKLIDYALLWLHEQDVVRLNKGLAVFRPAMTIHLSDEKRGFLKADFFPLKEHYDEQVLQIHVMSEYAQRGLETMADALKLSMDYFNLPEEEFINRWLPGREKELSIQTTPESWRRIVDQLNNTTQQRIVTDDREQTNVLVLAGPGSGKTRVLVHRIAYLIRVRRESPKGVLALAYNRHAAVEIRHRLFDLIGDDARGVSVLTCHALAMRMVGASLVGREVDSNFFKEVLMDAIKLLKGEGLPPDEADDQRDRLLAGFRWILVDEYQDVGPEQYDLISAIAGRTLNDPDGRLTLFAVGDDDQNIYSFRGASVEYIRRFEEDYSATPTFLTENYRSSGHIIEASNLVIELADSRMKSDHSITINRGRSKALLGGHWGTIDPVSKGRIQILACKEDRLDQALTAMSELQRMAKLSDGWDWSKTAVIAKEWSFLEPIRSYCEQNNIPVQMADEQPPPLWRLRETRKLIEWIESRNTGLIGMPSVQKWLTDNGSGHWWALLQEVVAAFELEVGKSETPIQNFIEWIVEWGRELRRSQKGLLLLTAHRAKGLEFDHLIVLDGAWGKIGKDEDTDASRRLYYVAMTRARQSLSLLRFNGVPTLLDDRTISSAHFVKREKIAELQQAYVLDRRYLRLTQKDIDLGFAGRFAPLDSVHSAISQLQPGAEIQMKLQNSRYELFDVQGRLVGRLAKDFTPPIGFSITSAHVVAVIERDRNSSAPEFQSWFKCDKWEVILPELIYTADKRS